MKVAVEGCCHGELDKIYEHIGTLERKNNYKVDLLLICGDFQAIRNHADLQCMAVPQKYRQLGGFHKYYLGEKKAPILTVVIGGNHEASNYMWELYHGGWLAPNIYFLGFSGCVRVNGIRIAGASGIYKSNHYNMGHYETLPYDNSSIRSIYHIRQYDVFKLSQLSPPDVFLSHDWPNTIEQHGDLQALLRRKPFFTQEAQTGTLGSPPLLELLRKIKPQWWFSAHLHTKFEALYRHDGVQTKPPNNPDEILINDLDLDGGGDSKRRGGNPEEIQIDDEDFDVEPAIAPDSEKAQSRVPEDRPAPPTSDAAGRTTRFLALDKCLPRRDFLQVIDIPTPSSFPNAGTPRLTFDPEWLAITRALHPFLCTTRSQVSLPKSGDVRALIAAEIDWVRKNVPDGGLKEVTEVQKFWRTAPGPTGPGMRQDRYPSWYTNPQTEALARLLQIPNKVNPVPPGMVSRMNHGAEPDTADENTSSGAVNVVPVRQQDEETSMHESDLVLSERYNGADSATPSGGDTPQMTSVDDASGGWSPSRVVE